MRLAAQYSFQPFIYYCHKLLIFTDFYKQKYILMEMNEMITYAFRFGMDKKNWLK